MFPGARDLLPLIRCGFFGGGRTGRDLLMGEGGREKGRKKEFKRQNQGKSKVV